MKQERTYKNPYRPGWTTPPPFNLMNALFVNRMAHDDVRWHDSPPYLAEILDGHTIWWGIREALKKLTPRERRIIIHRYFTPSMRTYEEIARMWGVTRERIRQIEKKALRKLMHPSRSGILHQYIRVLTPADMRVISARRELASRLEAFYTTDTAIVVALSIRRRFLAEAFRAIPLGRSSVGNIVFASCRLPMQKCMYCNEPTLPQWDFCSPECRARWKIVDVVCDMCGHTFQRSATRIVYQLGKRGAQHQFCSKSCGGTWLGKYRWDPKPLKAAEV